jgi:hypothetical protein
MSDTETTKRVRGRGKNPALAHVNLRLPMWVLEFYKKHPSYTGKMREVLAEYAQTNKPDTLT